MKNLGKIRCYIYLEDFITEHKNRLRIIKQISKKYNNKKIIFQLCILGIESLAKYYKPQINKRENFLLTSRKKDKKEESEWNVWSKDGWRFVLLMSKIMKRKEAEEFYKLFRCSYIHVGFPNPILDWEDDDNLNLAGMSWKDVDKVFPGANIDYPKETIILIYEELIYILQDYFKKRKIKYRIFKDMDAIVDSEMEYEKVQD